MTPNQINSQITFIEYTFIPDLKKSGKLSTANELQICLEIMKQQREEIIDLQKNVDFYEGEKK